MRGRIPSHSGVDASEPTPPIVVRRPTPALPWASHFHFWSSFLVRHYWHGAEHGRYGPPAHSEKLRRRESELARRSAWADDAPTLPVPVVDARDLDAKAFQATYLRSNSPVILRGFAADWLSTARWSPRYLAEKYGDEKIPVRLRGDGLDDEDLRYIDMTMAELVDDVEHGGRFFGGHLEDVLHRNAELLSEIDLPRMEEYLCSRRVLFPKLSRIASLQMFLSGAGTCSGFHCAGGPNLFLMIHGRKRWTMVDPRSTPWMHPVTRKDMFYAASPIDWRKTHDEIAADGYPLYRHAPKFVAELEPGDALFSPQWWWHAVETTEPSIGIASRTINQFFLGNRGLSAMWVASPGFRRLLRSVLRTGWGSDRLSGARAAFSPEDADQ